MRRRVQSAGPVVMLAVVVAGFGGCGGGEKAADDTLPKRPARATQPSTSTTLAPSTTADPLVVAEAEIRAAYDPWRKAVFEIMLEPDPNNPLIDQVYAPGELRDAARAHYAESQRVGRISDFPPGDPTEWRLLDLEVRSPTEAVLHECVLLGGRTLDKATGEVLNDDVSSREARLTWVKHEGKWKQLIGEELSKIPGVGGCATDF